jgi:hypothetical protein
MPDLHERANKPKSILLHYAPLGILHIIILVSGRITPVCGPTKNHRPDPKWGHSPVDYLVFESCYSYYI